MSTTAKRWNSLDCLKGIACIAVVLIHYNFTGGQIPAQIGTCLKAACRFAVPTFLCISGFFFTGSSAYSPEKTLGKLKHILKILFFSSCFFAAFSLISYPLLNSTWVYHDFVYTTVTGDKLTKLLLTHDPLVYSHLWYLLATACCYLVLLLFYKPEYHRVFCLLGPVLLVCYSCMQEFKLLTTSVLLSGMDSRIYLYNSFLFRALPFMLCGMFFRSMLPVIQRWRRNNLSLVLMVLLGLGLELLEAKYFGDCQFYLGSYLIVFALMVFALQNPDAHWCWLRHIGRDLSLFIYILHIAVGKSVDVIAKYAKWWGKDLYYLSRPVIIMVGTFILAEALFQLQRFLSGYQAHIKSKKTMKSC